MSKRLTKWENELLNPNLSVTSAVTFFDEQSNVHVIPFEDYMKQLQELHSQGAKATNEYLKRARQQRRRQNDVFGNQVAMNALNHLFLWAVRAGELSYYEIIPPDQQRELLDLFYFDALAGIKRAKVRKKRYDLISKAYGLARKKLLSFRKKNGIPNDKTFSPAQAKEVWAQIKILKSWKYLVNQSLKDRSPNQKTTWQKEHIRLRAGVNSRWREEFYGKEPEDTAQQIFQSDKPS